MSHRIVNTSPLLFLTKLDRLEVLRIDVERVFVPSKVLEEIRIKRDAVSAKIDRLSPSVAS